MAEGGTKKKPRGDLMVIPRRTHGESTPTAAQPEPGSTNADFGIRVHERYLKAQPPAVRHIVCIHPGEEPTLGQTNAVVQRSNQALVARMTQNPDPVIRIRAEEPVGVIGRAIVNDEKLEVAE